MNTRALAAIVALGLSVAACGDKVTVNPSAKGQAGESCTKRDDCGDSLSCIDGRCASTQALTAQDGGTAAPTGGQPGETCARRGDCQTGLVCMDHVCVEDSETLHNDAGISAQRGDRGETCTARSDCQEGLACVASRCRDNNYDLTVQPKQCFTVECATEADCCQQVVSPFCMTQKSICDSPTALPADKASACTYYNNNCACRQTCEDSQCVASIKCTTNTECVSGACFNSKCVACNVKADCGSSYECVDHTCKPICTKDEQCALFFGCEAGKCTFKGCQSDRECYFDTGDPRSKCENKECVSPCVADGECTGDFEVCDSGRCVNVGCETNAECRIQLGYANQSPAQTRTAVCKAPAPKM